MDKEVFPVNHYAPFLDWISDTEGNVIINHVGRFEDLQEEIKKIADKIGLDFKILPRKNSSKHKHYSKYYSDSLIRIISKHYSKDIQQFNYCFEDKRNSIEKIFNAL